MRKILVTGGAGFIGSNFIRMLRAKRPDVRVTVLDKLTYAGNPENLAELVESPGPGGYRFVKGDICDEALVDGLFAEEDFDRVVNFAAESHVDRSILGPRAFVETNVTGTFTLLEAARRHWRSGGEGRLFVHISTDEVYGSLAAGERSNEDSPYRPNSPYAASKAASDHLTRSYHRTYGLPVVISHCSNNYGPYQFPEKLIPLMIINALQGRELPVYGDGRNVRDWLHVADHCEAVELVCERGEAGRTYDIGSGREMENIELVRLLCDLVDEAVAACGELRRLHPFDGPRRRLIRFVADRPGHDRRYATDSSRIRDELGWTPRTELEEGLRRTVAWYIDNRRWWERVVSGEYRRYYELQYASRTNA
ncbi:MAG TPA: dTDP-glucose 4,6-dehydratase [Deltaproteobacteria bacterium]|nr:dTDP-glucose 4,6-dehydratase [Deltaproteobacteria bacterium]